MAIYKSIDGGSANFEKKLILSTQVSLFGADLKFTKVERTDLNSRPYGNLYSSFNLPITVEQQQDFTGGKYLNTAFQYLNRDKVIIAELPSNSYGEMVDGKSIIFSVPTTGGTVNIYSTFFKNAILNTAGNMIYSDPNQQSSQFGQAFNLTELPGQSGLPTPITGYSSNVAYLFSDNIQKPHGNSTYTWSSSNNYFVNQTGLPQGVVGSKFSANYSSADGTVDIPVGIAYLDKGFMVITDPTIVNSFDYTNAMFNGAAYGGNDKFTDIYFTSGASLTYQSFVTEFIQHAVCIGLPNEFYVSNNPSFIETYGQDNLGNNPVAITEVGLYNSKFELIAIAKMNAPVAKDKSSIISMDIAIKI